ncbi:MAG: CAP domain-containing protein [Sphingomicrobium sp.]
MAAVLSVAVAAPAAAQLPALDPISARLLAAHNPERALVQVPPLQWDPFLARSAASYGPALAAAGGRQHSPRASRPGQRENLWMGTRGAFLPEQMIASWAAGKRYFRPGIFPAVSTTGNWIDVWHYTTMIWPTTTRVGCATYSTASWDFLICRYSPPGNIDGRPLLLPPSGEHG